MKAAHQHDGGRGRAVLDAEAALAAKHLDELVAHDADDRLVGGEGAEHVLTHRLLLDAGDELLRNLEVDVGFKKSDAYLAEHLRNVLFRKAALLRDLGEDRA